MGVNNDEYDKERLYKALRTCQAATKNCAGCPYRNCSPYCVEHMLGEVSERLYYLEGALMSAKGYKEIVVKHINKHDEEDD